MQVPLGTRRSVGSPRTGPPHVFRPLVAAACIFLLEPSQDCLLIVKGAHISHWASQMLQQFITYLAVYFTTSAAGNAF